MSFLLVADLGGTKSRVGIFDLDNKANGFVVQAVYRNADYADFTAVADAFFAEYDVAADLACFAVAGVIRGNTIRMTNLSWEVDGEDLAKRYSWSDVFLLNDMTALSLAIPHLRDEDVVVLKGGVKRETDPISVIAPGTGLGQGYLVPHGDGFLCKGSEGGHSGFAPTNEEEIALSRWLLDTTGFSCAEQVCSGPAISTLYEYYKENSDIEPLAHVDFKVLEAADATPVIVAGALNESCPLCDRVMHTFLSTLGGEAANQALKIYARGGIYIGGGIITHLIDRISFQPLIDGFLKNGKMNELLSTIPVYAIKKHDVLMNGALHYATTMIGR